MFPPAAPTYADSESISAGFPPSGGEMGFKMNRADRIRTCDLFVPNEARYQPALQLDVLGQANSTSFFTFGKHNLAFFVSHCTHILWIYSSDGALSGSTKSNGRWSRCRIPLALLACRRLAISSLSSCEPKTRRPSPRPSSLVHRPSSIVHCPSSLVHRPSSLVHCPSSIVPRPSSLVHRPSKKIGGLHDKVEPLNTKQVVSPAEREKRDYWLRDL